MESMRRAVLLTAILIGLCAAPASGQYWYGESGRIPLTVDSSRVTLKFDKATTDADRTQIIGSISRSYGVLDDTSAVHGFITLALKSDREYWSFVDSLRSVSGIALVEPYYLTSDGYPCKSGADS